MIRTLLPVTTMWTIADKISALLCLFSPVIVITVVVLIARRASRDRRGPIKLPENAVFIEKWASGRSLRSWRLRFGGASKCLLVALSPERLVTALQPPFNAFPRPDLEHDIPLVNLIEVTEAISWMGPRVKVRFMDRDGKEQSLELFLNEQRRFMDAVRSLKPATTPAESQRLSEAEYQATAMLPLSEALRHHWLNLVPLCLLPTVFFVGVELFGPRALVVIAPLFFLSGFLAARPVMTRRAPYLFWVIAIAVWMGGTFPAALLVQLVKWLRSP